MTMLIFKKLGIWITVLGLLFGLMSSSQAAMIGTAETLAETNRAHLVTMLERDDVQTQMIAMGVDPDASLARVNQMTDKEVSQLNGQIDQLVAAAGVSNVELLLIIIVLILIL